MNRNSSQSKHVVHHHESKEETPVVLTAAPKTPVIMREDQWTETGQVVIKGEKWEWISKTFSSSLCKLLGNFLVMHLLVPHIYSSHI